MASTNMFGEICTMGYCTWIGLKTIYRYILLKPIGLYNRLLYLGYILQIVHRYILLRPIGSENVFNRLLSLGHVLEIVYRYHLFHQ